MFSLIDEDRHNLVTAVLRQVAYADPLGARMSSDLRLFQRQQVALVVIIPAIYDDLIAGTQREGWWLLASDEIPAFNRKGVHCCDHSDISVRIWPITAFFLLTRRLCISTITWSRYKYVQTDRQKLSKSWDMSDPAAARWSTYHHSRIVIQLLENVTDISSRPYYPFSRVSTLHITRSTTMQRRSVLLNGSSI